MDNSDTVKEIEGALIGAVLRDGNQYKRVREIVKPENFGILAYGDAWRAAENLHECGMSIDVFTVADELERMGKMSEFISGPWSGRALLSDLRGSGIPANVLSYAEKVQDYSIKRDLGPFWSKCAYWSANGRPARDIIKDVYSELGKIAPYGQADEFTVPFSVAVSEAYDETDAASQGKNVGVKTGLIDLDIMLGSLLPKNVYLVAARPGQGKTGLLLTVAKYAAEHGKRIGIFSLEMSRSQVAQRLISMESGINLDKIVKGRMSAEEWGKYNEAVMVCEKLPIIINDLSSIDINSIRQTSRKIKADGGLDLIILDYIQLADAGEKKQNRELEVSSVSRGLKYLARELEVPVFSASQMSREIEKRAIKRPSLSDLRESGTLEQDAYCVMFIYRPDETMPQKTQLIVEKHRNGPTGEVDLYWQAEFTKFESATAKYFSTRQEN